jgi:hypothetical protein
MLNMPCSAPESVIHSLLSQPEFGPASRIQPIAPRYGGVMKAPNTIRRTKDFAGMSVREIAHAMGTPKIPANTATPTPSSSELKSACRCRRLPYAST